MDKSTHEIRLAQWASIIQECNASGMTKKKWCQENNINEKQLYYWQRQLRKKICESAGEKAVSEVTFAELPVMANTVHPVRSEDNRPCDGLRLKIEKGSVSMELLNLSKSEMLYCVKELLADA